MTMWTKLDASYWILGVGIHLLDLQTQTNGIHVSSIQRQVTRIQ
jgi:hypothetical protein